MRMQIHFFARSIFWILIIVSVITANFSTLSFQTFFSTTHSDNWEQVIYLRIFVNLSIILSLDSLYSVAS